MKIAQAFHAVKTASVAQKKRFWELCKQAAFQDPDGASVGLTKIAYDVWADSFERGHAPASERIEREAFASSFGSAVAVDRMIEKMAAEGRISEDEHSKMANWVAESAVRDLEELTKTADIMPGLENGGQPPMNAAPQMPPGMEPPSGSLEGGQEGMPPSTDPNAQGGEAIGDEPQIADGALDGLDKAHKTVDNMIFLAKQVQLPALAQELDQGRDQLAEHFAAGHAYLPPELQHHFAQSEHAEAFMKKYKQRFGAVGGGAKKQASLQTLVALALGTR